MSSTHTHGAAGLFAPLATGEPLRQTAATIIKNGAPIVKRTPDLHRMDVLRSMRGAGCPDATGAQYLTPEDR
jgi:hypothetical protein